jgi:CRISPR-associated protein Cas1
MEQIIDIGEYGDKVRLEEGRIVIHRTDGTRAAVPVGDVAVLMFSEPCLSISVAVLAELAKNGGTAVACDRTHTPVGIFQPLAAHSRSTAVLLGQIAARPVLRARLWQRVVQAKIMAQARTLARYGLRDVELEAMARDVRRGDAENAEGHAALRYWLRPGIFF